MAMCNSFFVLVLEVFGKKKFGSRKIRANLKIYNLFHPGSNFNTLRHQFESEKTQKTAGRRLSVAIGNTKVTIAITIIQV
jgi:hypothetical protein